MPQFIIDRKQFLLFLNRFGNTISDLRLTVRGEKVTGTVGRYTHYLTTNVSCTDGEDGIVIISDLAKVLSFLRNSSTDDVKVQQTKPGMMLYITCGNSKIHLPSMVNADSHSHAGVVEKMVKVAEETGWTKWSNKEIACYGQTTTESLKAIKDIHKVLGANSLYHVHFMSEEGELAVKAGKQSKGRMFVTVPLENTKGPAGKCVSAFSAHFPQLIESLPNGTLDIHTGESVPFCVKHEDSDTMLVVIDQDYEEGWE